MNCCKHKYFVIYRGDDTDFPGNQELIVELNTERDLTGCSAHFSFQGFTQDFAEIPSDKKLRLVIPNSETGKFALGAADAKLWLTNGTKVRTVENRIHVVVTNRVDEAYDNDDPQAITVTISGGGSGATVVLDDTVTEESPNGVKSSGIWSWVKSLLPQWLTSDYAEPATAASVADKADKTALEAHVANTNNPHAVTAAQVGSVPFVDDSTGEKTAVTIGSRIIGESVSPHSLANGDGVTASGYCSHAEGGGATASGYCSHAEGGGATASGDYSHAEGGGTAASGDYSHSEGYATTASGDYSHAEGSGTTAAGMGSHAEGSNTIASGTGSHTDGINSRTRSGDQFAFAWNGDDERSNPYTSNGPGTFNINPVGGTDGFYIGEQTLPQVINAAITGKADIASLAPEYSATSAYSVGAIVYHDDSIYQCKTAIADGGEAWNAEHWELRKLDGFFTESNSLLNGRLAYSRNATGLKDRAFNTLSFDGTEYNLSTALAAVTPTASGQPRDLLIVATATAATTISFTAGTIKGDKPTIDGSGTWLITLTEYASGVWYCRQIKMEDAA